MMPLSLFSMSEGVFDFLDIDIEDFVESALKDMSAEDPFPNIPPGDIPSKIFIANDLELSDTTRNGLYTIVTRSVNGIGAATNGRNVWYQHVVWENYGIKEDVKMGRKADILFKNTNFDAALNWHYKVLKYLDESGL